MRGAVGEIARKRKQFFGFSSDADIETKAAALHKKYCPTSTTKDALIQCSETAVALTTRIEELTSEKLRYLALRELADLRLAPAINDVRDANGKLAASVEHLVFAEAVMMALAPHVGRQRAHDLVDAAVDETRQGSSFVDALRR
ncbi:MAG: hypothetical protein V3V97_20145, partial [Hyphomicrobiaceae bacterium]